MNLEDIARENLQFKQFDPKILDERAQILVYSDQGRHFFTRDDIVRFHKSVREAGDTYEASDYRVLRTDVRDSSRYASITYEVTWRIKSGKNVSSKALPAVQSVHVISHEIWERQINGWHRLFAAID